MRGRSGALRIEGSGPPTEILDALTAELVAHGFRGTSVDRIAARARISKSTLYRHFSDKTEILHAAIGHAVRRANATAPKPPAAADPQEALAGYSAWVRAVALAPEARGLYRVSIELARDEPQLAAAIHRDWRSRESPLLAYFNQLTESGVFRLRDPALAQTRFGFLSMNGLWDVVGAPPFTRVQEKAWGRSIASLFWDGYGAGEPRPLPPQPAPVPPSATAEDLYDERRAAGMRLSRDQFEGILEAAAEEFLARGYLRATTQPILQATGVSNKTLIRQMGAKADLFRTTIRSFADRLYRVRGPLPLAGNPTASMRAAAVELHRRFHERDNVRLLQLAVGEATRFPDLSVAVYQLSRGQELAELSAHFAALKGAGFLRADLPDFAAEQFHTLAIGGNKALFSGEAAAEPLSEAEHAAGVCRLFLTGCRRES